MARCRRRSAPASPSPSSPLRAPAACSSAPGIPSPRPDWSPPRLLPHLPPPRPELHGHRPALVLPLFTEVVTTTGDRGLPQTNERRLENSPSALVDGRCRRRATASGIEVGVG